MGTSQDLMKMKHSGAISSRIKYIYRTAVQRRAHGLALGPRETRGAILNYQVHSRGQRVHKYSAPQNTVRLPLSKCTVGRSRSD